tara:strand:+ start:522 stop:1277 length:756 start_codon:yes stop_codon:yes gene_type:complete
LKLILILVFFFSKFIQPNITLEELDFIRQISDSNSISIVSSGTKHCEEFFKENRIYKPDSNNSITNSFSCKFSYERNRFYIFMLANTKDQSKSVRENCLDIINNWPEIIDHLDKNFFSVNKTYLNGFLIENLFNNNVLNITNIYDNDIDERRNQINKFIIDNRNKFSSNDKENNELIKSEISKLEKIYNKIINQENTSLDKLIINQINKVTRYKIFVNDLVNFQSFSCNWVPGKGLNPYVKREKFSEFENI